MEFLTRKSHSGAHIIEPNRMAKSDFLVRFCWREINWRLIAGMDMQRRGSCELGTCFRRGLALLSFLQVIETKRLLIYLMELCQPH